MTSTPVIGIKTLSQRLAKLEQTANIPTDASSSLPVSSQNPVSFAEQILSKTMNTVKDDLTTVLEHYEDALKTAGIDINNMSLVDLVKAVPVTIVYVEKNIGVIAGILKKDVTSDLKLQTAITFIQQYISTEEHFIVSYIEQCVDLVFNNGKKTLTESLPNTKKSQLCTPSTSVSKGTAKRFKIKAFGKK